MHRTPVYRTIVLSTCVLLVATGFTLDAHRYIIRPRVGPCWNQSPVWHTEVRAQRFHLQCRQYCRLWRQRLLYCLSHLHMQPAQSSRRCVTSSLLTLKDSSFFSSSGRVELRTFLGLYLLTLPLQLLTTGSLLEQGSTALVVLTAIHAGVVTGLFWALLANAIVATQVVEDGTLSSLIVCPSLLFDFALIARHSPTTYSQSYSLP